MNTDKYFLHTTAQLKAAQSSEQVEKIISASITDIEEKEGIDLMRAFQIRLQDWLESLSPLDWDSTQWGNLRYAFIYLRKFSMMEHA